MTGLLEARLPFFGIWFPEWFYKLHPNIKSNIEYNAHAHILTTPFDIYETLKDILEANYNGVQRHFTSRSQSHLYKLPTNRTCKTASVPDKWCTCLQKTELDQKGDLAFNVSAFVVNHLNFILENASDLCQKIKLSKILYVQKINFDKIAEGENVTLLDTFRVGIKTNPFNATFEAIVRANSTNGKFISYVDGDIIRTSYLAGLSDCVNNNTKIVRYCPCYNV